MTQPNSAVTPQPAPGAAGAPSATPTSSAPAAAAPIAAPAQPVASPQGSPAPAQPGAMVPLSALHEERQKRQELSAQLEQLQQTVRGMQGTGQPQGQPAPQEQNQGLTPEAVDKLWEEDPKQAVRTEILMAFNWYDRMGAGLEGAADSLAGRMPDFNTVRGQVMNYIRTLPLNQRTPQAVEQAYYMMRGQNVDAIIRQREQEWQQRSGAPAQFQVPTTGTYGAGPVTPGPGIQLTNEQLAAADAMGMSREEYAKNIKVAGGAR